MHDTKLVANNKIYHLLLAFAVAALAVYFFINPKVAQVGDYSIYKNEVECRDAIILVSYPDDKRKLGLYQLTQSYQHAQILKNFKQPITKDQIQKEKERIDKSTLMPENLAKIKSACGGDGKAYENAFILPTLADRVIYYEFFLKNQDIHRELLEKAQVWRDLAIKSPGDFGTLAKKENHPVSLFTVSLDHGLVWAPPPGIREARQEPAIIDRSGQGTPAAIQRNLDQRQEEQVSAEGKKWIEEVIAPLQPGQVSSRIIDQGEVWMVVKYLRPTANKKNSFNMQAAIFPKRNYGEWLEAQKKMIPVNPPVSIK
ncbi:MAG: hypothetical protein RIQ81_264 [Pseudomonadota bacterium]